MLTLFVATRSRKSRNTATDSVRSGVRKFIASTCISAPTPVFCRTVSLQESAVRFVIIRVVEYKQSN